MKPDLLKKKKKNGNSNPSRLLFRAHKPVSRTPAFDHARAVAVRTPLNDFETLKKLLLWLQTEEECYYLKKLVNTHVRHPSHLCYTFHLPEAPQVNFAEFVCSSDYQRMERRTLHEHRTSAKPPTRILSPDTRSNTQLKCHRAKQLVASGTRKPMQ